MYVYAERYPYYFKILVRTQIEPLKFTTHTLSQIFFFSLGQGSGVYELHRKHNFFSTLSAKTLET